MLRDVSIDAWPGERFEALVGRARVEEFHRVAARARAILGGRIVWNVNSTASGGGVAEMLQALLAYARGAGIDARWLVMEGDGPFFRITKRLHNWLHGVVGDGGELGPAEDEHYREVSRRNARELLEVVRRGDVVLLHDPQTAGLGEALVGAGAVVVWRCHVGRDEPNEHTDRAWAFLRPHLTAPAAHVFSRSRYVPAWMPSERVHIIPPSIDPFSPKNQDITPGAVRSILAACGLLPADVASGAPAFTTRDGSAGVVSRPVDVVGDGPLPPDAPLVVQVSRWDRLKDMTGVLAGFAEHVDPVGGAHLALVGPEVKGVADDPEGADVLEECIRRWRDLPADRRARVRLVSVPMEDVQENAAVVNAVQRHATVVVQKSLVEGFGLTVAEAMWKARPVVASGIGGIRDQITDGEHGVLLADPTDLRAFGRAVTSLLADPGRADRLGGNARRRVEDQFLGDRHLIRYADLLDDIGLS